MTKQSATISHGRLLDQYRQTPEGMVFYETLADLRADRSLSPYLHLMARAWETLDLKGILCVNGLPTLYLTIREKRISASDGANLQRLFWNQGLATVFAVVDPETVRIYSGLNKPTDSAKTDDNVAALVENLSLADHALNLRTFLLELATGSYYQRPAHKGRFDSSATVDAYLLNNLSVLSQALVDKAPDFDLNTAHTFIARILFVCYLTDRKIIDLCDFPECRCQSGAKLGDMLAGLRTVDARQRALHSIFHKLKDDFNGSMFEPATLTECRLLGQPALNVLTDCLCGHELGTGQYTLDFWAYDFRFIPVETISAIYETFLKTDNEQEKRSKGAYYTPRFLVETIVDLALPTVDSCGGKSFLDPACGSGIFLVAIFNRLASRWMTENLDASYDRKADALKEILREQICGVDVNQTACRIACFSLYLAFLDCFDRPDIKGYIKRKGRLPSILKLRNAESHPPLSFPVIYEDNFLAPSNPLPSDFDVVVGNPPWFGRGAKLGLHHRFAEKIPDHLAPGGTACILLPSKMFLNDKTKTFQDTWLRAVTVEEVVQLADYRKILFQDAHCPCMIVRFRAIKADEGTAVIEYVTPQVAVIDRRNGIVPVAPRDRKVIPLRQLLAAAKQDAAPSIWKQYLRGTPRDLKFLNMLQQMQRLCDVAGAPGENKRWVKGQGFIPANNTSANPQPRPWKTDTLFIDANRVSPIIMLPTDCEPIGERFPILYRNPSHVVFKPPRVLVSQGVGKGGMLTVAYSDFSAVFRDSLQAISGPPEDEDLLLFLTVYLRSKLARYFLFHTAANWGTERDKVLFTELLQIPFPLPGSDFVHRDAETIVHEVASRVRDCKQRTVARLQARDKGCLLLEDAPADRQREADALQSEMEPLIYQYFDLIDQEIMLVEDTVEILIPSSTPGEKATNTIPSRAPVHRNPVGIYAQGLQVYADVLSETLNAWAESAGSQVRITLAGGVHEQTGMAHISARLVDKAEPFRAVALSDDAFLNIAKLAGTASTRKGCLEYLRGIIAFQGSTIHIFKPVDLIGWTRTAALNDASEIYARIADARNNLLETQA